MSTPDELSKFVSDIIKKTVLTKLRFEEKEVYEKLLNEFNAFQNKILSKDSITKLSETANINFKKVFPDLTIEVNPGFGAEIDLAKSLEKEFNITIKDSRLNNINQSFTSHGHGVIRQAMFNILGLVKNELPVTQDSSSRSKEFLILFEEPEIYLHHKAINSLRNVLYDLCLNSPFQILCASHSPALIDISRQHTSLVRIVKNETLETKIYQVDHDIFTGSDERKKQVQMINRFNPHICESFFTDEVVIVEGDTEAIVIRDLLARVAPERDIFVLNSGSKNNLTFFQKIFTHFNIKHHVIHDSDTPHLFDKDGIIISNKNGSPRKNSAWKINSEIWDEIEKANKISTMATRFIHVPDFEQAHGYEYDIEKGKPLSAFEYAQNLKLSDDVPITRIVNYILNKDLQLEIFSQENLEKKFETQLV